MSNDANNTLGETSFSEFLLLGVKVKPNIGCNPK
jgi:hypothetical protein